MSEWIKAASIALTIIAASVEDERAFSILGFVKDDNRSRLDGAHFDAAMFMAVQHIYNPYTFPYAEAVRRWFAVDRRVASDKPVEQRETARVAYPVVTNNYWNF
jgi:hypothetical protein